MYLQNFSEVIIFKKADFGIRNPTQISDLKNTNIYKFIDLEVLNIFNFVAILSLSQIIG